jgi:hypothetical protein
MRVVPRARQWLLVPLYVVVAAIGLIWGGRNTYRSVRNRAPLETTCAQLIAHPPKADWVRLDGCVADLELMGIETRSHMSNGASITDSETLYIPLRPIDATTRRAKIVLRVDDGPLLQLGSRFATSADAKGAHEVLARPLEGLVEHALDSSERTRTKLQTLGLDLADDFVIVAHDERPRPLWLALGVLSIGLGGFAMIVRTWRRRRRPVAIPVARVLS